jgi:hypothetical protein
MYTGFALSREICLGGVGFAVVEFERRKANLILQSDTVCHFSSRLVMIQAGNGLIEPLQTLVEMMCEDS